MLLDVTPIALTPESILSVINVRSPISGNVSHIHINIGASLAPSQKLMDVVDNTQLHLDLFVFEQDLTKIKVGQSVDITLTNLPGKHYAAKIFAIGSAFDSESKSIPIHAAITGDKLGLIEGMNVSALISIGNNTVPAVATTAITSSAGNDFIFIQTSDHGAKDAPSETRFKMIQVKRGVTNGGYTEITPLSEIPDNAKVVNNGAFYLMAMLTNQGGEHEH